MTKSKIEWTQFTSNPVRGKCPHACSYCYAERQRIRFKQPSELSFHPKVLEAIRKQKKPSIIFMGSHIDMWAEEIPKDWIFCILDYILQCSQHTFIFLTKNPERFYSILYERRLLGNNLYPKTAIPNFYFGATITNQKDADERIPKLLEINSPNLWLSIEPLVDAIDISNFCIDVSTEEKQGDIRPIANLSGIIIGAMTGSGAIKPKKEWVLDLIEQADDMGVKVFIKRNLRDIFPELPKRKELIWTGF